MYQYTYLKRYTWKYMFIDIKLLQSQIYIICYMTPMYITHTQ